MSGFPALENLSSLLLIEFRCFYAILFFKLYKLCMIRKMHFTALVLASLKRVNGSQCSYSVIRAQHPELSEAALWGKDALNLAASDKQQNFYSV